MMEKHSRAASFTWKTTRFLVLSLTLLSFLVFISLFSFFTSSSTPLVNQDSLFLLNTPSVSVNLSTLNLQSLTGFTVNTANLTDTDTLLVLPQNASGFVANSSVSEVGNVNTSVGSLKDSILRHTHVRKPENSSGFLVNSNIVEGNEVQKKGNFGQNGEIQRKKDGGSEVKGEKKGSLDGKDDEGVKKVVKDCDVSKGRWVVDESYPLYTNLSCPFIDEGFDCQGNGRPNNDYMKWRWQPQDCEIPRFNATNMLEMIRGKRVVFAGDSINRNQWESLLCLLMGAVKDPSKVYEIRGRRILKQKGTYSFRFVDYKCTVEFYVSHFLVHEGKARIGSKRKGTLRIDTMDKGSSRWKGADILIFNSGNWWNHYKTKAGVNYFQERQQVYPHLDALTAYRKALATWAAWVDKNINPHKTQVFFRSTAAAHFREGQWNSGGHCREAQKPLGHMYIDDPDKDLIAEEVIRTMKTPVTFLDVSGLSSYRIDGHPSKYGRPPGKRGTSEDCSHWCLPGVPDAWNELIYHQLLLKQKKSSVHTS